MVPVDQTEVALSGASCLHQEIEGRAMRAALTMCSGLIGVALNSTPNSESASETAFAMAAGGATAPPSPTPLTPSGLSGDGDSWWSSCMLGLSLARGNA